MLGFFAQISAGQSVAAEATIVASIKPLHSLVSGVMAGIGEPVLLIDGTGSPHGYALRPSEARAVNDALRIFWIGPSLERFLVKITKNLPPGRSVTLIEKAEIEVLRYGGQDHAHKHADTDTHDERDPHIWLDPLNAIALVRAVTRELGTADPQNAQAYELNAAELAARLTELDTEIAAAVAPVRAIPYVVFHDAYRYFERRYGMNVVGSIVLSPERAPGAKHVRAIRERIGQSGAQCVFHEPQVAPRLVETVIEGAPARRAPLDPLGAALSPGPELYFTLLRNLASALVDCLSKPAEK